MDSCLGDHSQQRSSRKLNLSRPRWLVFDLHGCDFGFVGCCFLRAGRQISRLYLSSLGCFWKLWSVKWHQNSTEPPDLLNNVKMSPWVKTSTVNHGEPKNSWLMLVVHWSGIVSFTQSPVSPSSRHKWDFVRRWSALLLGSLNHRPQIGISKKIPTTIPGCFVIHRPCLASMSFAGCQCLNNFFGQSRYPLVI
jgi:hypothetical protein